MKNEKKYVFNFIRKKKDWQMFTFMGLFLGIIFLSFITANKIPQNNLELWWNIGLDAAIGLTTFFSAIFIAYQNYKREAIEKIEKRLTVHFLYKDQYVFTCVEGYLSGVGDIRAMAQQIGRQMAGQLLNFYPFLKQNKPVIRKDQVGYYQLYEVKLFLTSLPGISTSTGSYFVEGGYTVLTGNTGNQISKIFLFETMPNSPHDTNVVPEKLINQKVINNTVYCGTESTLKNLI